MATYIKTGSGQLVRQGVRAIKTKDGVQRIASLWVKTAAGIVKIYETVRACFSAKVWRTEKPWTYKDKWNY